MAKGQHSLEEITIAIDLEVLLNVIKVQRTVSFAVMQKVFRPKDVRKANCSGMH
jgi:hypothetical protein